MLWFLKLKQIFCNVTWLRYFYCCLKHNFYNSNLIILHISQKLFQYYFVSYIALLALRWKILKALTSLGGLFRKFVTQTLFDRSLADISEFWPRRRWINLISRHNISFITNTYFLVFKFQYYNVHIWARYIPFIYRVYGKYMQDYV